MNIEEILRLVPVRACEFEYKNGLVIVLFENKKLSFIEKKILKKERSKLYKIELDEIGSYIWENFDGKTDGNEIVAAAEEKFGDKVMPAQERVGLFIKQMAETKLINLFQRKRGQGR